MSDEWIECQCVEVTQPIGTFYVVQMTPADLIDITYVDVRRIEKEKRDVETILGIQRPLSNTRVAEIAEYVNTVDATFPSSIILAVDSYADADRTKSNIKYDRSHRTLSIRKDGRVAKVLDGQHRIEGLRGLEKANEPFDVLATIFVDADIEQQALIFATINKTQTKVNKSLVYDLFELAKNRSPEKTCHNIAILLDRKKDSPFHGKIKILGTADNATKETLTQATFVEALLRYVSDEPMLDRDALKRHPDQPVPHLGAARERKLFLREWFRADQDAKIAKVLINYFSAVEKRWPKAWGDSARGFILNRSTGYLALMRFLKPACDHIGMSNALANSEKFEELFAKVKATDEDFTPDNFLPGATGQRALYQKFVRDTDFDPQGLLL